MVHPVITQQVRKKAKRGSKLLSRVMVGLAIFFVVLAIVFTTGYMMFAFIFALLYFGYSRQREKDYEYVYENGIFRISVIRNKVRKKQVHELRMDDLEVIAPNWHEEVLKYRKDGGTIKLPKYDYTSYEESIPYYTMIITEKGKKIKLLLDLNREMLDLLKRQYPQKVFLS